MPPEWLPSTIPPDANEKKAEARNDVEQTLTQSLPLSTPSQVPTITAIHGMNSPPPPPPHKTFRDEGPVRYVIGTRLYMILDI